MSNYKLTITVNLNGQDDPDARQQANELLELVNGSLNGAEIKLQQVFQDKPPRNVQIDNATKSAPNQNRREELLQPLGLR